jgi:3D (Asp-Asp-Asp) domain-containing protein
MKVIPATKPKIPADSGVSSKRVLTQDDVTLMLTDAANNPVAGAFATIQSDRAVDIITQPSSPTNASGTTTATVETRDQSANSTIISASNDTATASPGIIQWLPAHYENDFLVTCYVISNESDYARSALTDNVPGLPPENKYRQGFITDVRMQGSGQSTSGSIIHYDGHGRYSVQSCALTATGACAVDGVTIAVDPQVIPRRGTVAIDGVGTRVAQDTGGAITGYHIDVYYGARRPDCRAAGRRTLDVDFNNY